MFDVGRICVKIAGRDAGKQCVIVEKYADGTVLIDGQTRRRKCNVRHVEPTSRTADLKSGATHDQVKDALEKLNIDMRDTKPKKAAARPVKQKAKKEAPVKEKKPAKKAEKVVETKAEPVAQETPAEAPKKAEESAPAQKAPAESVTSAEKKEE